MARMRVSGAITKRFLSDKDPSETGLRSSKGVDMHASFIKMIKPNKPDRNKNGADLHTAAKAGICGRPI
jgi:hypothetical protein